MNALLSFKQKLHKQIFLTKRLQATEQLTRFQFIKAVCNLIHETQKERGLTNIYLGSKGELCGEEREKQAHINQCLFSDLITLFDEKELTQYLNSDPQAILYLTRITAAYEKLQLLQTFIQQHSVTPLEMINYFNTSVELLLNFLFHLIQVNLEPKTKKPVLGLYHLLLAKEYTGQERAWGALGFAETHFSDSICLHLAVLQNKQQTALGAFKQNTHYKNKDLLDNLDAHSTFLEIAKLRKLIAKMSIDDEVASSISAIWFELFSHRIDALHHIELSVLSQLHRQSIAENNRLQAQDVEHFIAEHFPPTTQTEKQDLLKFTSEDACTILQTPEPNLADIFNTKENHSIDNLLAEQSERIKAISSELKEARDALEEQKVIYHAKLILIEKLKLSEKEAHSQMQKTAMHTHKSLLDIAKLIIQQDANTH